MCLSAAAIAAFSHSGAGVDDEWQGTDLFVSQPDDANQVTFIMEHTKLSNSSLTGRGEVGDC